MNLPQPPEGVLNPKMPWSRINPNSRLWLILKSKLTGRRQGDESYTSYVNLSDADADRLIANIKKDPRGYPSLDQESGTPIQWMERQRLYQEWLVEAYLNNPFEEPVSEKIVEQTTEILVEAQEEIQEAETKEEVSEILEDKIDILEDIQEKIAPPPTENKIPDPWEGSETVPTPQTQKTDKKKKKKKKPKSKKKPTTPPSSPPPKPPKRSFASKFGGGVKGVAKVIGKKTLNFMEKGGPVGQNMGPSVLRAGAWIGNKISKAFEDAKKEKERALKAEANGAEIPPEVKEKGYFLKKSLGYQFGGKVLDQTVGTFFENIPSKQSSKKAGFGDKFDYGDGDPKNKKQQSEIKDLATGFRNVTKSLSGINKRMGDLIQTMSKLVGETSRVADTLEGIQNAIAKSIDVEIDSGSSDDEAQQATGDINIPDIDLSGLMSKEGDGLDWFDMLFAADDARDIAKRIKGGGERNTTRRGGPKITGDVPKRNRFKFPSFPGRRFKFAEGTAGVASPVRAMIGEAGPEMVTGSPRKFAEGGALRGAGSNILATGLGATGNLMKKVQPFANLFAAPFQVVGSWISTTLSNLVSVAGPFSGVIAKIFSPPMGGLATIFGLNQGAFAAEINSAAMTEKQGANELSRFFANFFKLFGINIGGDEEKNDDDSDAEDFDIKDGPVYEKGASIAKILQSRLGIKDYQAAAIVGNMIQESGLQPDVLEGSKKGTLQDAMNKGAGYSYPQWTIPSRQQGFAKYMESKGHDWKTKPATDDLALGYVIEEFPTYDSGNVFKNSKDIASASNWVLKNYEGPAVQDAKEKQERVNDSASVLAKMARGGIVSAAASFSNKVKGLYQISGPDTGYIIPKEYTGGETFIGHGEELLAHLGNKMLIAPIQNKEYDIYKDPARAYNRYEQIGRQSGVEVSGGFNLVDFVDRVIFGPPHKGPSNVRYQSGPRDAIEAIGGKYYAPYGPDSSFKPVRGASLPEGQVVPLPIPKDTVTGTVGSTVAVIQPMVQIQYVPGPVQTVIQEVPANIHAAAKALYDRVYYSSVS